MGKAQMKLGTGLGLVVFFGIVWLWRFGWSHWPTSTNIVAYVAGGAFAIVYIWKFIITPFREGAAQPAVG